MEGYILKLLNKFKGLANVSINDGRSCLLWDDLWGEDTLAHKYPEHLSFAKKRQISFKQGISRTPLHGFFHLPLSQQAHAQLINLQEELNGFVLDSSPDTWSYIWNSSFFFSKKGLQAA